jgi:hypothetical protein
MLTKFSHHPNRGWVKNFSRTKLSRWLKYPNTWVGRLLAWVSCPDPKSSSQPAGRKICCVERESPTIDSGNLRSCSNPWVSWINFVIHHPVENYFILEFQRPVFLFLWSVDYLLERAERLRAWGLASRRIHLPRPDSCSPQLVPLFDSQSCSSRRLQTCRYWLVRVALTTCLTVCCLGATRLP